MGFLSGVLSNIQNHLGQHKTQINEAIEALKTNKHAGKKGFSVAIGSVVAGVRGYNDGVRDSNNRVMNPIKILQEDVKHLNNQVSELDENNSDAGEIVKTVDRAEMLAKQFFDAGQAFCNKLNDNNKHILDLNSNCRDRVNVALNNVSYEGKRLYKLAEKERGDLKSMEEEIKSVHEFLKAEITKEFTEQVTDLVYQLNTKVTIIRVKIEGIGIILQNRIKDILQWIKDANATIQAAKYRLQNILDDVKWDEKGQRRKDVENAAKELRDKASELHKAGESARKDAVAQVKKALEEVASMNEDLKKDLGEVKLQINKKLGEVKTAIGKLNEVIRTGTAGTGDKNRKFADVFKHVKSELYKIRGSTLGSFGLEGIKKLIVDDYSKRFKKTFESTVQGWIKLILDNNSGVKGWVGKWIKEKSGSIGYFKEGYITKGKEEFSNSHTGKIAEAIRPALGISLENATIQSGKKETDGNLVAVYDCIKKFEQTLSSKIDEEGLTSGDTSELVKSIVKAIETEVRSPTPSKFDYDYSLERAVKTALAALQATAQQVAEELKLLIGHESSRKMSKMGDNLDSAVSVAKKLFHNIEASVGEAFTVDYVTNIDQAIDGVAITLGGKLPYKGSVVLANGAAKVNVNDNAFPHYTKHVSQSIVSPLTGNPDNSEGALPLEIGKIGAKVREALTSIDSINNYAESQLHLIIHHVEQLCGAVRESGEQAQHYLNDFINNSINGTNDNELIGIKMKMEGLIRTDVAQTIEATKNFQTESEAFRDVIMKHLEQFVNIQVDNSTRLLTTAARRNYVTSIKSLLTAFADKVSQELAGLPAEIDRDLQIGFKGFMRVMGGNKYVSKSTNTYTFEDSNRSELFNVISEFAQSLTSPLTGADHLQKFKKLSTEFNAYFANIHRYIKQQITPESPPQPPTEDPNVKLLDAVNTNFDDLLNHLKNDSKPPRTYLFDNTYTNLLSRLSSSLTALSPSAFANPRHPELLDAVRAGLRGFVEQMERVYVNGYEGDPSIHFAWDGTFTSKLSDHGKNCCKVFLTVLEILSHDLEELMTKSSKQWMRKQINTYQDDTFGRWFERQGYKVNTVKGKQHGELQDKETMMGSKICDEILSQRIKNFTKDSLQTPWIKELLDLKKATKGNTHPPTVLDILQYLSYHLHHYYEVCHLGTSGSKKQPSSIYEMLIWFAGLPNNSVHRELTFNYFSTLFDEADEQASDENKKAVIAVVNGDAEAGVQTEPSISVVSDVSLPAYPHNITPGSLTAALTDVCAQSHSVLTAIQGHGHAGGVYAVDFNTNEFKFSYPSDPAKCFDVLVWDPLESTCRHASLSIL
ncbi:hypothetical protein, conserved [Babesia bigemina]|uniref:Extracellular matrix-binding ebh n=1 Tax=Babesia bigemina TaxID=5866 RepID=A0A061BL75_BABBI|nr:hypothetical protein, conserved [Babesia bigemina]CDR71630.1 hypothetical protein, conserved [Babesia bigemina]|eukprot:XP_012770577.1 hypothetical protein, conserved [Babesia bigemina]